MTEAHFIERNEKDWTALEACVKTLSRPGRRMPIGDVREFARLFRLTSHHLAYAKTHYPQGRSVRYLNRIVGVAHNHFYVREQSKPSVIWRYFTHTFPEAVRDTWKFSAMATVFFALGLLLGVLFIIESADGVNALIPFQVPTEMVEYGEGLGDIWDGGNVAWDHALMSAFIMTNNIAVSFNAFAWGITGGIGTVFVLVYNGLIIGALFGFFHMNGADMLIAYSLVLPHGVIELFAIFLCGGAGLMIGKGLLAPGEHTRKHSIILYAKRAVVLIPGIVFLLVAAGLIEGFFTPLNIAAEIKLGFAGLTGIGLTAWFWPYR